jgi:predicted dehydrogenase
MYRLGLGKKAHFETPGPGAGLLKDRGSHIIDQALCLFGLPEAVFGDLRITRPESVVDDYFEVLLYYPGKRIRLKGAFLTREPQTAYIVHGLYGSFLKSRGDRQEALLLQGHKPDNTEWCTELPGEEGLLHTERDGQVIRQTIPTEKGNYTWFYEGVYKSITAGAPPPVTAEDGLHIMRIIEAAMESNLQRRVVPL